MLGDQESNTTPMIEIFGGIFALMLVLFLIINLLSHNALVERLETAADEGLYRVGWGANGTGFVVITFPQELRIVETAKTIPAGSICNPSSPFVSYIRHVYQSQKQQIIFAILENSVSTMAEARNCIMDSLPGQTLAIGWIIANNELLKSVSLNDIPSFIKKAVEP